jgi:guanylate kinase
LGLNLEFSVSAASRKIRPGEVHGKDYFFMNPDEFRKKIDNNEFLEWEEVYPDHFYGTLKSEVDRITAAGRNVIFDVDVKGGLNIKKIYGDRALSVFVMPPGLETLEARLRGRSTESGESLHKRLGKAAYELGFAGKFDMILVNDDLDKACREAEFAVKKFLDTD